MVDEKKDEAVQQPAPEGKAVKETPAPNQNPSEESQKRIKELENQVKERDAQISDLNTTKATIEARQREVEESVKKSGVADETKARVKRILETSSYDPDSASAELTVLLSEVQSKAARDAVMNAQQAITIQSTIDKLRKGIKNDNPEFDEDVVDVVLERADALARTGKVKTAEEAVKKATDFVKSKFESYAKAKNSAPPLPEGALAETGANKPPEKAKPDTVPTPEQEIEDRKTVLQKKVI